MVRIKRTRYSLLYRLEAGVFYETGANYTSCVETTLINSMNLKVGEIDGVTLCFKFIY